MNITGKKKDTRTELEITKDTNLGELAATYPDLAEVLQSDYGLHCIGCFASSFDTLETGAMIHGYGKEEVEEMVKRLVKIKTQEHKNIKTQEQ